MHLFKVCIFYTSKTYLANSYFIYFKLLYIYIWCRFTTNLYDICTHYWKYSFIQVGKVLCNSKYNHLSMIFIKNTVLYLNGSLSILVSSIYPLCLFQYIKSKLDIRKNHFIINIQRLPMNRNSLKYYTLLTVNGWIKLYLKDMILE